MQEKLAAKTAANNTFGAIAEEYLKNLEDGGAAFDIVRGHVFERLAA